MTATSSNFNKFPSTQALAVTLAKKISHHLRARIEQSGHATLAVSGGSTPKRLFQILSSQKLPWHKVTITLVDERWVPLSDPRSNAQLVNDYLQINEAKNSKFLPLFLEQPDIERAIEIVEKSVASLSLPLDVVILGMGDDGHTASFFPNADNLAQATDLNNPLHLSKISAPGAQEPRVTFNLSTLIKAGFLALHIEGEEKLTVLTEAQKTGDVNALPIRHILRTASNLEIFWAPQSA